MIKKLLLVLFLLVFVIGCAPKTEIRIEGQEGSEIVIAPSVDMVIKGTVTISFLNVPAAAKMAGFAIQGPGIPSMQTTGPNIAYDKDGSNGWSTTFDTTEYDDGQYTFYAIAFDRIFGEGDHDESIFGARVEEVIIQNNVAE